MSDIRPLLRDAYWCSRCPKKFGFRISPNGSYFKFPPLIGATGKAEILFVGINPRRSRTNEKFHQALMTSKQAFKDLAFNRLNDAAYIHPSSIEPHYHDHLGIIRQVYGEARLFESCAAVTELFLCATKNSESLPYPESPCADHFLPKVLAIVQPEVIIAVGSRVMAYFNTKPAAQRAGAGTVAGLFGHDFTIVKMPHPGNTKLSKSQRDFEINACVRKIRKRLGVS